MLDDARITYFGDTNFRNQKVRFGIKSKDRRQHFYIIGKSGTGKTALLHNLAVQDIKSGSGLCVVDPHGEFVEGLLSQIPKDRLKDVVYINPADSDYHTGFNVLEVPDPRQKHLVASGLMGIFTKIWANVWSARMEYIMNNCVLALLDTPGATLLGIPRMLVDKNYRQRILNNVKDPVVLTFWVNEYENWQDKFRSEAIAPIQNKVGQFLSTPLVRNIVGQKKSTVNMYDMMNERKIILLNVSKGRIGEDNSDLLGSMFITKIQLSAMERVRIPENEREDFYLFVDEFQNFATDSFAGILSEARKYRLNLTIAHQYIGQLIGTEKSTKVKDAVFGNVGTMVIFRVGAEDAEFLEQELTPDFLAPDMVNLPNHKVYIKLMIDGETTKPFSANTLAPYPPEGEVCSEEEIIDASRKLYCRSKKEVEKEINEWSGMDMGDDDTLTFSTIPETTERARQVFPTGGPAISSAKPTTHTASAKSGNIPGLANLGIEFEQEEGGAVLPPKPKQKILTPPAPIIHQNPLSERLARASTQYDTLKEIKQKLQKAGSESTLASALKLEEMPLKPVVPPTAKPMTLKILQDKKDNELSDLQKTIRSVLEKDAPKKEEVKPAPVVPKSVPVFVPPVSFTLPKPEVTPASVPIHKTGAEVHIRPSKKPKQEVAEETLRKTVQVTEEDKRQRFRHKRH